MTESLFSPSWYRVAPLKPRLRGHATVSRHEYRGEVWHVLQDHAKGQYFRFDPASYRFIGRMDGKLTVQQLWDKVCEELGDDALTQEEVVRLLGQLHAADVLLSDVAPDTSELTRRSERFTRAQWAQTLRNPLALRIPLMDPDRFLSWSVGFVRPLFTVWGALFWLAVVVTAITLAGAHWSELTDNIVDRVINTENLFAIALVYPFVKTFHELGHAYAVKSWGGEVHSIGIILLVLMPVPYVDASAASEFRSKYRRAIVGAAGILVELFIASLAMFAWLSLGRGKVHALAFNVMVIASVSTLLFNGNPLLRYDGYYVLADLLEIPNLSQRGLDYLGYLVKRYPFGVKTAQPPHTAKGEKFWFLAYTLTAFVYRTFVYVAIFFFLAAKFLTLGLVLSIWAAATRLVVPVFQGAKFVFTSPLLRSTRGRAVVVSMALVLLIVVLLALPIPSRTVAEGVVWIPEESLVRAGTDGFVARVVAEPGSAVKPGDLLVECTDPILNADVEVRRARLQELQSRFDAAMVHDRVEAEVVRQDIEDVKKELARASERMSYLEIRSPVAGTFVVPNAKDLPDHYLKQGDLVGFVVDVKRPTIRVAVSQAEVDLVRQRTRGVAVRLSDRLGEVIPAQVKREVPEGDQYLPSTTLGSFGGGRIPIDPRDTHGMKTFEKVFQLEIQVEQDVKAVYFGGRAFVRFDHGFEPVARQAYRRIRQLFLKRLNV